MQPEFEYWRLYSIPKKGLVGTRAFKESYNALDRIKNGTFGVCTFCAELILEERMLEVPNATKCVECKEKEKLNIA